MCMESNVGNSNWCQLCFMNRELRARDWVNKDLVGDNALLSLGDDVECFTLEKRHMRSFINHTI